MTKEDLARNIYISRKALQLNHEKLVELTGITRPILSGIENKSANPTLDSLLKLQNSLKISFDMMFISEAKFKELKELLKLQFETKSLEYEVLISEESWKTLIKYSGSSEKQNLNKVAKICGEIVRINFGHINVDLLPNMMLGASLGVIFQQDGFKSGLEFGAWLGNQLR
jgi:transcriptional regulator with XRE-family HTH domain